jgi:hypothetical protein
MTVHYKKPIVETITHALNAKGNKSKAGGN